MKVLKSSHPIEEYNGFWWIPGDPENKYFGNLKIDENGEIYLQIFGNSRSTREEYLTVNHSILCGICENNVKITVFSIYRSKGLSSEFFSSSIEYRYCLIGFHVDKIDDIRFDEIHVNISELFGWFINFEAELISQKKNRHFKSEELYEDEDRKITICGMNAESSSTVTRRIEIQRKGYLKIEYRKSTIYHEVFEELKLLSMLMSVLARKAILIQEILIPYEDKVFPKKARFIINNQTYFRPLIDWKLSNKHGRGYIVQSYPEILNRLYNFKENEKFILEILSNKYLKSPGDSRIDFFNIISAYESWHRTNIVETDENNTEIYNQIIDLVKENKLLKDWVGSRSIIFKSMSLPKRIEYLMNHDPCNLISNQKTFKKIVSATRNMIAHNLKMSKSVANFAEIIVMQNIIHSILEVLFLRTLPLPEEFISAHIEGHPIIERTISQIKANKENIRF